MRITEDFFEIKRREWDKTYPIGDVVVIGKDSVGKSSLINNFVEIKDEPIDVNKITNRNLRSYKNKLVPLRLYEVNRGNSSYISQDKEKNEIFDELKKCIRVDLLDGKTEKINVCWYCLDATSFKIEEIDIEWIKQLSVEIPVIVVITEVSSRKQLKLLVDELESMNLNYQAIVPIYEQYDSASNILIDFNSLEELCTVTYDFLPEDVQDHFLYCSILNQEKKILEIDNRLESYMSGHSFFINDYFSKVELYQVIEELSYISSYIANNLGIVFDYVELNQLLFSLVTENELITNSEQLITVLLNLLPIEIEKEGDYYKSWHIKALMLALIYSYLKTCDSVLGKIKNGLNPNFTEIKAIYRSYFLHIISSVNNQL